MDKIRIENLEIFAKHGVFPEENFLGQKFAKMVGKIFTKILKRH